MSSRLHDDLVSVRALLDKPENWIKRRMAATKDGYDVGSLKPKAECFCLLGASNRVCLTPGVPYDAQRVMDIDRAVLRAIRTLHPRATTVTGFNDKAERTHAEIIQVLDIAVEMNP